MAFTACSAVDKLGSVLLICELALRHEGKHRMGDIEWDEGRPW
jgi:hypothetical protein